MDVLFLGIPSFFSHPFRFFLRPRIIRYNPRVFFCFGCDWNIFEHLGTTMELELNGIGSLQWGHQPPCLCWLHRSKRCALSRGAFVRLSGWWAIHLLGGRLVCLDERQDGWRLGERSEIDENWNVWIIMDNIHITYYI